MAATRGQRIGIWVIAIFMAIGTIGSFAVIILSTQNQKRDQARYLELQTEYQAKLAAQATTLSDKYYPVFSPFASRVGTFDAASVTELATEDLTVGEGDALTADSSFTAYYIGWTPDGKIFDQSIDGKSLKAPIEVSPGGVIEGWTNGVKGMQPNGVRELTIPADQAYGETGHGDAIPPNTPLKFLVMIIPTPETVEVPAELMSLYGRLNSNG